MANRYHCLHPFVKDMTFIAFSIYSNKFHITCSGLDKTSYDEDSVTEDWIYNPCSHELFPFSNTVDENLYDACVKSVNLLNYIDLDKISKLSWNPFLLNKVSSILNCDDIDPHINFYNKFSFTKNKYHTEGSFNAETKP